MPRETAWFKAVVQDPINWDVNWVRSTVTWDHDDDRVTYVSGKSECQWLWLSGWEREDFFTDSDWYYSDNQSKVTVSSDEHFHNDDFCINTLQRPGTDHVFYNNVNVTGNSDGSADGSADVTISGPCAHLLEKQFLCSWT